MRKFDILLKEHNWEHKWCVDVCNIASYKISMEGVHLKLVKDIPRTLQNSYFICGSLFDISRSVRLQKILGNNQYGWGFHTPLEMKCDTTLRQRIKIQSTSPYQPSRLEIGTLVQTRSTPMKKQRNHQN